MQACLAQPVFGVLTRAINKGCLPCCSDRCSCCTLAAERCDKKIPVDHEVLVQEMSVDFRPNVFRNAATFQIVA